MPCNGPIGLELFLLIDDPWRVFFTTDHPNGAPFTAYPELFALLMSRDQRAEWIATLPADAVEITTLKSIAREYSLGEIADHDARSAGAAARPHRPRPSRSRRARRHRGLSPTTPTGRRCSAPPRLVFKDGELVVRDGAVVQERFGRALVVAPTPDRAIERRMHDYCNDRYGLSARFMAVPRPPSGGPMHSRWCHARADDQRRPHRRHVRRGISDARDGVIITRRHAAWARQAAVTMTGFATSVIGCGCEAGIDRALEPAETPDGRPGVRVLLFAVSTAELQKQLAARVGQCVLTSPGSACYAGLDGTETLRLGNALRYFGDGWQISKRFGGKHYWRIPVMDGEFLCEATTGLTKEAVGGGNLLIMGRSARLTLAAAQAAARRSPASPTSSCRFPAASCARDRRSAPSTSRCSPRPTMPIARPCAAPWRARSMRTSERRSRSSSTGSPRMPWRLPCGRGSVPSSGSGRGAAPCG